MPLRTYSSAWPCREDCRSHRKRCAVKHFSDRFLRRPPGWRVVSAVLGIASATVAGAPQGKPEARQAERRGPIQEHANRDRMVNWIPLNDHRLTKSGLPWIESNAPHLWRLPAKEAEGLPDAVRGLMRFPAGGRLRFASDTSQLRLRVSAPNVRSMSNMSPIGCRGFDAYVDGVYWCSNVVGEKGEQELTFFAGAKRAMREIAIYLPLFQEVQVLTVGVANGARLVPTSPFALGEPIVYYGSSIAQGASASRPGMTYEAILGRRLNVDFVDLGFSGAGKAEPEVVELVASLDACCFVFDLGKSFRKQPEEVYGAMLDKVRAAHPEVPMICLTPIYSTREAFDDGYRELSEHVRKVTRSAATKRIEAGDRRLHLVEGLELLGPGDSDAFQEGVHPTDLGFTRIADRLEPLLRKVLRQ